jgi:uncharacterized iron-regulated protein
MLKSQGLRRVAFILLLISQAAQLSLAQEAATTTKQPDTRYLAFDPAGKQVTLEQVVEAFGGADVVLVGEQHDDPVAHLLEAELLRRADERHGAGAANAKGRPVALSLEMFERDVQLVVDEYLAGLISERHFLLSSRPWKNYEGDYKPMVEYARGRKLPVIAANAPARYVSRVSANGPAALAALSEEAKRTLPPLPFRPASEPYAAKFRSFMGLDASTAAQPASPHGQTPANPHGALHLLDAQNLRDASMGHAIAEHLRRTQGALVYHVNGKFHSEERLGVAEHVKHYRPQARVLVVTILSGEGFPNFDAARLGRFGDYVILTDPSLPRSRE